MQLFVHVEEGAFASAAGLDLTTFAGQSGANALDEGLDQVESLQFAVDATSLETEEQGIDSQIAANGSQRSTVHIRDFSMTEWNYFIVLHLAKLQEVGRIPSGMTADWHTDIELLSKTEAINLYRAARHHCS